MDGALEFDGKDQENRDMVDYDMLIKQMKSLAEESSDCIPVMANASALLFHSLPDINWAGFYLVKGDFLQLGPFQGKVACVRIGKGRGVCGTAWEEDRIQLVPDVHSFAGHIACDSDSRSEIVVPIHNNGVVAAVLDIDSPVLSRFDERDKEGLARLSETLEQIINWEE